MTKTMTETHSESAQSSHSESAAGHGSGGQYQTSTAASQKPSVMLSQEELQASLGSVPKYGVDAGVAQATGGEGCRFKEGFDQPAEFNMLEKPLILPASFQCCDSCTTNPGAFVLLDGRIG